MFSARGDDVSHPAPSNGGPGGGGVNVTPPTTLHNLVDLVELTSPMTLVLKKSPPKINKMVNCTVRFQSGRTIRERTGTTTSCHDYVTLRYAYYA